MSTFRLPLSGNVAQTINPWNVLFNPVGSQIGLVNIDMGESSQPEVEQEVLTSVASYGRQIGRIEDALMVLLSHFHPSQPLKPHEQQAISDLRELVSRIHEVKQRHHLPAPTASEMPVQQPAGQQIRNSRHRAGTTARSKLAATRPGR